VTNEQPSHQEVVDATTEAELTMRSQSVPVNMYEASGAVVVIAPLPAVTPDDVTVELRDSTLRFWAHLRSAAPRDYILCEWDYGGYEREVEVPHGYGSGIEASMRNGQLAIRVLKGAPTDALCVKPRSE
jgi:HSP20 family molecular chaperone IbpA